MLIARGDGCTYSSFSVTQPVTIVQPSTTQVTLFILQHIERDSEFELPLLKQCWSTT